MHVILNKYVARMIEREEIGFDALLNRPGALRHLSGRKVEAVLEWLREYAAIGESSPIDR